MAEPHLGDEVEEVSVGEILMLRAAVLRPNLPLEASCYAEDEAPDTHHLAVRLPEGRVVGCATYFPDPWPGTQAPVAGQAWRLRGMATAPEVRGSGAGGALLQRGIAVVGEHGGGLLWCNARTVAVGFYARYGFQVDPEEFPSGPHHIPHHRAWRPVGDAGGDVSGRP